MLWRGLVGRFRHKAVTVHHWPPPSLSGLTVSPPYLGQPAARSSGCLVPARSPRPESAQDQGLLKNHQDASSSSSSLCLPCCRPGSQSVQVKEFTRQEYFRRVTCFQRARVPLHVWRPQLCLLWEFKAAWQGTGLLAFQFRTTQQCWQWCWTQWCWHTSNVFSQTGKINAN